MCGASGYGMHGAVDQCGAGGFAGAHADGSEHYQSGGDVAVGAVDQRDGCGGGSKHFQRGKPGSEFVADALQPVQSIAGCGDATEDPGHDSDDQSEFAGVAGAGASERSSGGGADYGGSEFDFDYGAEFRGADAGYGEHFAARGRREAGDSECERVEEAMESAGVRADRKDRIRCGAGGVRVAVKRALAAWTIREAKTAGKINHRGHREHRGIRENTGEHRGTVNAVAGSRFSVLRSPFSVLLFSVLV